MTSASGRERAAVRWLTAQAVMFGVMAALLGIVANAMFLAEYGSAWLPVTYLFIAAAGIIVSGAVARSARTREPVRVASTVLAGGVLAFVAAWVVAVDADGAWVSGPLLVLFPVLLQLGFVFIGGQAGHILDIGGIKAFFPRIVAGFPAGAVIGGVLAGPMLSLFGRTEHLLLATAAAQAAFLGLLLLTDRRFPVEMTPPDIGPSSVDAVRPPLRSLLTSRFVLLIIGYQVLSAMGSQLVDFLVFDRAAARYQSGEDLARFVARYTAAMNVASIVFLALLAGVLLRRFGLRLGIAANPMVLAVFAIVMTVITAVAGGGSTALLATVAMARIADIALTDGTTRTSINATYQVLPSDERLAVQASVEGVGVPVAIGASGVLILALDALPFAVGATVVATTIVCFVWSWIGVLLYREYAPALVGALRRLPLLDVDVAVDATGPEEAAATRLLGSGDEREVRLGLDMLTAMSSPVLVAELERLADDPRPEVGLVALVRLAGAGNERARKQLRVEVLSAATSTDPGVRLRAARALGVLGADDRAAASHLLRDPDPRVRTAAIEGVRPGDLHAIDSVIDALGDVRTRDAAAGAFERLGDAVVPAVTALLHDADRSGSPLVARVVRAAGRTEAEPVSKVLGQHVGHRDRELGLTVLESLVRPGPAPHAMRAALDDVLLDDAHHAARVVGAMVGCTENTRAASLLHRALGDELALIRRRVAAGRLIRHGSDRLGAPLRALDGDAGARGLAIEALEVTLLRAEAVLVLPVLRPELSSAERLALLPVHPEAVPSDAAGWLADLLADAEGHWRSRWLRACALHTVTTAGLDVEVDVVELRGLADPIIDELLTAPRPDG